MDYKLLAVVLLGTTSVFGAGEEDNTPILVTAPPIQVVAPPFQVTAPPSFEQLQASLRGYRAITPRICADIGGIPLIQYCVILKPMVSDARTAELGYGYLDG